MDLDEVISLHRQALELRPVSHPGRWTSLTDLAIALRTRFTQSGQGNDIIEEAISLHRQALDLRPASHPGRSISLDNLGVALLTRFTVSGQDEDLEEAILLHRQALELRPIPHPHRSITLGNLANTLGTRFPRSGQREDMDDAISLHRQAVELPPVSGFDRSLSLHALGVLLRLRFTWSGQREDLEGAILLHRQTLELRPLTSTNRSTFLNHLGVALRMRFTDSGQIEDLEEAISFHRQALYLQPALGVNRPMLLGNLGHALQLRFTQSGQREDLEEFISFHRESSQLLPASHPFRSWSLANLASALNIRFSELGQDEDLDEAISLQRQALRLLSVSHRDRSTFLNNLGGALRTRFTRSCQRDDLEEGISLQRQAVELLPTSHTDRYLNLRDLAYALRTRFTGFGYSEDLEEAILLHRTALALLSDSHPKRSEFLHDLASALSTKPAQTGGRDLSLSVSSRSSASPPVSGSLPSEVLDQPWDVSPEAKAFSDKLFDRLDAHQRGYISDDAALPFMLDSKLPEDELAQIWRLVDFGNDGRVTRDGFAVVIHLFRLRLAGDQIPSILPLSFVPLSMRSSRLSTITTANEPQFNHLDGSFDVKPHQTDGNEQTQSLGADSNRTLVENITSPSRLEDIHNNPHPPDLFNKDSEKCLDGRISRPNHHPVAGGGFADIYEGLLDDRRVAIKCIRPFLSNGRHIDERRLLKRLWREYAAWTRVSHPIVLECLGFTYEFSREISPVPALISPWMSNGALTQYLVSHPGTDCLKILFDVADGLSYLHDQVPSIIHGDIRGDNILISDSGRPLLSDFGLSKVLELEGMSATSERGGSLRWMSCELLRGNYLHSTKSDVWAYAMTVLEILSGRRPYAEVNHELAVFTMICGGQLPLRPTDPNIISVDAWAICQKCWNSSPEQRPSMREVILELTPLIIGRK